MSRPQRYRLTVEFVLRDRGDYAALRSRIHEFFRGLESSGRLMSDFAAIEKCEDTTRKVPNANAAH